MGWFLLPYFLLLLHFPSYICSLCNHYDGSALLQFKTSFTLNTSSHVYWDWPHPSSDFSSKTESWKNGTDCCEWDGVTCDTVSGHVIGLDLSCSNLYGQFHPNSTIFKLRQLQQLNLAYNYFYGSLIYPGFGDLVNLTHLNLSYSFIGGEIPSTISHLSKLVSLDLSEDWRILVDDPDNLKMRLDPFTWKKLIRNATSLRELRLDAVDMSSIKLSSLSLLMNVSSSLVILSLSSTRLQGILPRDIFLLPNLQELSLSSNRNLTGELPKSNWSTPLMHLDLFETGFSGEIPNSIGHLKSLNFLVLSACHFNGPVPLSLWNLSQLTSLVLTENYNLNGEIPSLLSNLKHLVHIDLSENNFSGNIPNVFGNFNKLEDLALDNNDLSGLIPSSLFHLPRLSFLDLSDNKLVGPIPRKITKHSKLIYLYLSHNMLNGTIPYWCCSLSSLSYLSLNDNQFTGSISRFSAYSLESLDLSNNKLQGNFPNSVFELKNLTDLSLSSTDLSDHLDFQQFSKLKNLFQLDLSRNNFLSINFGSNVDYISPNLEELYLSSCNINSFPQFLAQLHNLYRLDLSNNKIQGKIPKWFHEKLLAWRSIRYMDLSFNQLQGDLPIPPIGIEFFSVSNNNFTGDISSTICNASSLYILNLAHNILTGMIPKCIGTFPSLSVLDLQMNNLHGNMPRNFSKGNAFETIKLNGNQLVGPLPRSLAYCKNLEVLDLAENSIEDIFPNWLETLQQLQVLSLRSNKFHGVITSFRAKHPFPTLKIFEVSNNNFSGPLPASYIKNFDGMMNVNDSQTGLKYMGNMGSYNDSIVVVMKGQYMELVRILTTFTSIDLSNNVLEGEIPRVIGELNSLRGLNLSHNRITGTIPQSLSNLRDLEWLDLSSNQLRGEIPVALTNLNFLSFLNLSQNQFEGIIPTGRQFDTFGNDSYKGNPKLCGVPLSRSCNNDEKWSLHSTFHHEESGFGWKAVAVGYASGMVFGMVLGYNVFFNGKPQWLARLAEAVLNGRVIKTNNRAPANPRGRN